MSYLEGDGTTWKAIPGVAQTREEVLAAAGSRYTYSANTMAYAEAIEGGAEKLALVGMSCQSSVAAGDERAQGGQAGPSASPSTSGCCAPRRSTTPSSRSSSRPSTACKKQDMVKMNIKGVFQIWMKNGDYHEVRLKECHAWTREGCKMCPDFAAEHADISTGGIGAFNDWTLTIVRTDTRPRDHRQDARGRRRSMAGPATTTPAPSPCCASCPR